MPKNEIWWNPYRFVPVRKAIVKSSPATDERFQGLSGFIKCSLANLSLLFIGGGLSQGQFVTRDLKPVLPGSSIKGMLRCLAEIVGGGCFITDPKRKCKDPNNLCITCRMFGMLSGGNVHKGQISPGDGLLQDNNPKWKQITIIQGQPQKSHSSFYKNPENGAWAKDMMKMYFHQPANTHGVFSIPQGSKNARGVVVKRMLEPGHTFKFTVNFENLKDQELNLLLYVLALEERVQVTLKPENFQPIKLEGPMRHKLGNAKGQGPGSCHITIDELAIFPEPRQRFASLQKSTFKSISGDQLKQEILSRTRLYHQKKDDSATMKHLRKMMVWDPSDKRTFRYPDYLWFKADANKNVELKSV